MAAMRADEAPGRFVARENGELEAAGRFQESPAAYTTERPRGDLGFQEVLLFVGGDVFFRNGEGLWTLRGAYIDDGSVLAGGTPLGMLERLVELDDEPAADEKARTFRWEISAEDAGFGDLSGGDAVVTVAIGGGELVEGLTFEVPEADGSDGTIYELTFDRVSAVPPVAEPDTFVTTTSAPPVAA
jgi:hypothetical protein